MNTPGTIISNLLKPQILIFLTFIFVHVLFFNYNIAEWGDSYRMLRSAEFIKRGVYPSDEKRPPFFSFLLALNPGTDQVIWGRIVVFVLSLLAFLVFRGICAELLDSETKINTALLLFSFNPVVFYWSIRIMSDVLFMLLVLSVFWFYLIYIKKRQILYLVIAGLLAGLSVLTRFEGYILLGSLGLGIFLHKPKELIRPLCFGLSALILVAPYWYFRNPLTSTYLEEPGTRKYDLVMIAIYLSSLIFAFGSVLIPYFVLKSKKFIVTNISKNYPLLIFICLELILVLLWPAAVPRLFMPIIPFFIIFATESLPGLKTDYFDFDGAKKAFFVLLPILVCTQFFLKLQFLVSNKINFFVVVLIQLFILLSLYKARKFVFHLMILSTVVWAFFVVDVHKNVFISVKNAGEYVAKNLQGNIAYNDVSSVSDWYTNYKSKNTRGFYYNTEKKRNLDYEILLSQNIDYLIITNEHNTTMTLDLEKRPYLELLREFRYNVNGKEFFAKVVKLRKTI